MNMFTNARQTVVKVVDQTEKYFQLCLLFGIGLLLYPASAEAGQVQRTQSTCHPVGRVILSHDLGIANGTEICAHDDLVVGQGLRVDLLCPSNGRLFKLQGGRHSVSKLCRSSRRTMRRCSQNSTLLCSTPRGQGLSRPLIRSVYGDTFIQPPKSITWQAVPGAQQYRVFIEGEGQRWSIEQPTTSLDLKKHHVGFSPDATYLITVVAYRNQQPISESAVALNIISPELQTEVQRYIDEINQLQLSHIERVKLIDGVYRSENLLHQTITMLEKTLRTTESGEIRLLLGDRYWDVGRPDLAKASYTKAIALGQQFNRPIWIQEAKQGLSAIAEISANVPIE